MEHQNQRRKSIKAIPLILLLGIGSTRAQNTNAPDKIDLKIGDTLGRNINEHPDLSWLNDEIRPMVIERLLEEKNRAFRNKEIGNFRDAQRKLISVGHGETIFTVFTGEALAPGSSGGMEWVATEDALPQLIPLIYDKPLKYVNPILIPQESYDQASQNENKERPGSIHYANVILFLIRDREVFSLYTRKWAGEMIDFFGNEPSEEKDELCLKILRQWWEHNKTAITEKRYADATWLPMYKGKPSYLSDEEVAEREAEQERERLARRSSRNIKISESAEIKTQPPPRTLGAALISLSLLLLGFAVWRYKASERAKSE